MGLAFRITRNDISPRLTRLIRAVQPPERRRVLRAMGTTFLSIIQGNFNSVGSAYRPLPWPNKRDGTPATLKKSGLLAQSFHLEVNDESARVSNPTIYAAIHQFGGVITPKSAKTLIFTASDGTKVFARRVTIPARPFFPVLNDRLTPAAERLILRAAERVLMEGNS